MWKNRNSRLAGIFLSLFTAIVFSNCATDKKIVDPYRDSTYTGSVAQDHKIDPKNDANVQGPVQDAPKIISETRISKSYEPSESEDIFSETMLPLLTLVNDRIVAYEEKVEGWDTFLSEASDVSFERDVENKITHCYNSLKNILSGYDQLHLHLINQSNGFDTETSLIKQFLNLERRDINFLESDCAQVISPDPEAKGFFSGSRDALLRNKEQELKEKLLSGEYLQVINLYTKLPLADGQQVSFDTVYNYGQALLRSGRENEAAEVFQNLLVDLREQNHIEREFNLMQLIADIQFGMENFDQAFERYIHIINRYAGLGENIEWARKQQTIISARNTQGIEVRNYAELIRSYISYNADRDAFRVYLLAKRFAEDFHESSVLPTVNHILFESKDKAEAWYAHFMQRISMLKVGGKFQDALHLIEQLPMHEMPMEKREELELLTDELISASFVEQQSKLLALEESNQETWDQGQSHMQAKKYDDAIEVFATLLESTFSEQAKEKIIEASQLSAQEDRRKAAELFVQASNTSDPDNKVALLFQSRQLLRGILKKYPQSGLVEKVKKNIERIEDEIRSIDPSLFVEADTLESIGPEVNSEFKNTIQQAPVTNVNDIPSGEWNEQVQTGKSKE